MKTVAIIPAYNEEKRIVPVIRKTKKYVNTVIVVDDGSEDRTAEVSRKAGAKVIRYKENQGAGFATRIGIKEAIKGRPDILIFLDADGQHDPKYIPQFIDKIRNGADYVYGRRDLSNYPFRLRLGNWGLKTLANIFCPTGIQDPECGYRAFSLDAMRKINLRAKRYEKDMEFVHEVWRNKLKVDEVRIKLVFHPERAATTTRGFKNFFYLLRRRFGAA
jgi:glycosyltransferase involved in cell wall biosynthesis